jgi:hypothetical protein
MRVDEKTLASRRHEMKTSVTAQTIEAAEEQAGQETELVEAAKALLQHEEFAAERFPLQLDLYWKLDAGLEVKVEEEDGPWFMWANWALREQPIPLDLRKRVAREICQADLDHLMTEEGMSDMQAVIAEAKKEKEAPQPWPYTKGELIISLIGNEPFTVELLQAINEVQLKVKEKGETKDEDQSGQVCAKVKSYQISTMLPYQEEMGMEREVVMVVQVAAEHEEKFFKAIKKKCKGFKCEILEVSRSPKTQNKPEQEDLGAEKEMETVEASEKKFGLMVGHRPYKCKDCGHVQDESTNHTDDISAICKKCSWKPSTGKTGHKIPGLGGGTYRRFEYAGDGSDIKENPHSPSKQPKEPTQHAVEAADMDSEPELPPYLVDLGTTLLADAVASETGEQNSEYQDLRELFVRPQEDVVSLFLDEALHYDLDPEKYVDKKMLRDVERRVNEQWQGKVTLQDLYEENESAAHGLISKAVGMGVSHTDDKDAVEWLTAKGVNPDVELPYYESPYEGAWQFLSDLRTAMSGDETPMEEAVEEEPPVVEEPKPLEEEAKSAVAALSPDYQEILKQMNGSEVSSLNYEGVVGIEKDKVIRDGEVIDTLDTEEKVKKLWDELLEGEGIGPGFDY